MKNNKENVRVCRNGLVALEDRRFEVDTNNKEDFLKTLNPNTAKTVKVQLLKVDKFEKIIGNKTTDYFPGFHI